MNRIDRITAILIQLQSRRVVRAQDIAERFGISLRTVYRDIRTLEEAGVPVVGEAGVGYSLVEGYRLPPVMFTREEATAFLTAEKFMQQYTDPSTAAHFRSAMDKIRAVLRGTEQAMLETLEPQIAVLPRRAPFVPGSADNLLPTFLQAIARRQVLRIRYTGRKDDEATERDIEPIGAFHSNGLWYLIAFCRLRQDYRNFRADRCSAIQPLDALFDARHPHLREYLERTARERELVRVVLRVDRSTAAYLEREKYHYGFCSEHVCGNEIEMVFLSGSLEGIARWYLMFADYAQIVEPPMLRDYARALLADIGAHL